MSVKKTTKILGISPERGGTMNVLGFPLVIVGILVIAGFALYYFLIRFFNGDAPIVLKVGVPTFVIGLLVLLASVVIDRCRAARTENFKEVEN